MRTLMMIASAVIVGAGTFCIANSSVSFLSTAFIVGEALLFLGIVELAVSRMARINAYGTVSEVNVEGLTAVILGVVFLSNQVYEDVAVVALFAFWLTITGLKTVSASDFFHLAGKSTADNMTKLLGAATTLFGVFMFFNSRMPDGIRLKVMAMVGIALLLIGINRFRIALAIEYQKPEFLTGNHEKLKEAKREEKEAMKKAKDAIRETKEIQRRIDKINKEIAKEDRMREGTEGRRAAKNS